MFGPPSPAHRTLAFFRTPAEATISDGKLTADYNHASLSALRSHGACVGEREGGTRVGSVRVTMQVQLPCSREAARETYAVQAHSGVRVCMRSGVRRSPSAWGNPTACLWNWKCLSVCLLPQARASPCAPSRMLLWMLQTCASLWRVRCLLLSARCFSHSCVMSRVMSNSRSILCGVCMCCGFITSRVIAASY